MTDEQRVDPRYDPAFQRGFEGAVVVGRAQPHRGSPRRALVSPAPYRVGRARAARSRTTASRMSAPTRSSADDEPEPHPNWSPVSRSTHARL